MFTMRRLVLVLVVCTMAFFASFCALLVLGEHTSDAAISPDDSYATIGGVQYDAVIGRQINPGDPVDARIIKGLPANERHAGAGHVLYGAFVARTNTTDATLPSASHIDLIDSAGHLHRPLQLSAKNPYTYLPSRLRAGDQVPPAFGTPAADNLAAGGQLLLYRVPAWQVRNGLFELVVHNPHHPSAVGYLQL